MNKLKEIRLKKKLKIEEVALRAETTANYLYMIERGVRTPGINLAFKIAKALDETVDSLFGEIFEEKKNGNK